MNLDARAPSDGRMRLATLALVFLAGCATTPAPVAPRPEPVAWPSIARGQVAIRAVVIEAATPCDAPRLSSLDIGEALVLAGREARVLSLPTAVSEWGHEVTFTFEQPAPSEPLSHG